VKAPGSRLGRLARWGAGALVVWVVALVVMSFAAEGCMTRRIEDRIAFAFEAQAKFAESDLSLVRGGFTARDLVVTKDAGGSLRITVASVDADLAPLGWALYDRSPSRLELAGIRLEASSLALLKTRRRSGKKPFSTDALVIRDVHLAAMPTSLLPSLGRLEIHIERARAGPVVMRTALSWVFSLEELVATVNLPGGVTVQLAYAGGKLRVQGGAFGATPVEVPFAIPILDPAREMEQLQELGIELAKQITYEQAGSWLRRQVWDRVKDAVP
jgi:hypothetical protein